MVTTYMLDEGIQKTARMRPELDLKALHTLGPQPRGLRLYMVLGGSGGLHK